MNIRPKTIRRLSVLFALTALAAAAVGFLLIRAEHRQRADIANERVEAFKAYNAGDYPSAVKLLGSYLTRSHTEGTDRDALFAYAKSRAETPMENGRQTYEAIGLMERYLQIARGDAHDSRHELLKLYLKARYPQKAREMAVQLLAANPKDVQALQAEAQALINEHKYEAALEVCHKLNAVNPTDLSWQQKELLLMNDLKRAPDQIVAHASKLLEAHPGDARFQTLMAVAYVCAHDDANAAKSIQAAAALPLPPDADSILLMARVFDSRGRFDLSDALLNRAMANGTDPQLEKVSIQRLFERQKSADVAEKLQALDPTSPASSSTLLGYRAMALYELHKPAEASPIVSALTDRKDDQAIAWALALQSHYAAKPPEPVEQLKNYTQAIARDPENPVFRLFLGDTRASIGESDSAIREWGIAQKLSPSWALPAYHISREFSATGRYAAALQVADGLRRRAPNMLAGEVSYAVAWWGLIASNPQSVTSTEGEKLLKLVELIHSRAPSETDVLPLYVALLNRRGRHDDAVATIKAAVAANPPLSEAVLGQLSRVSAQEHLDLSSIILDRAEQVYGLTPSTGFSKAMSLYESGKTQAAMQLALEFRKSHAGDPVWQVAAARFLDAIGDPQAVKAWAEVCDAYPDNLAVQSAALGSPSKGADRSFWQKTIDRVKSLTGSEGQISLVEEARWQLAGQPTPQELDVAIASLERVLQGSPELADVHRLLAEALLRTSRPDRLTQATAELTIAHDLQPDDFQTVAHLASLLGQQGQPEKELELVDALTRSPGFTREKRLWAAGAYADLGHSDVAVSLLTDPSFSQAIDANRDGMLAAIDQRSGRTDDAAAIYRKLLDEPTTPAGILADGAQFFARARDTATVNRFLERMRTLSWPAGEEDAFRANLAELAGDDASAVRLLSDAAKAHPSSERLWKDLAGIQLRQGKLDEAINAADSGLAAIPGSAVLQSMRLQIGRLRTLDESDASALRDAVARNPQQPAVEATLKSLTDARARNDSPAAVASALRLLADQNAGFMPLQIILINRYLALHQYADAITVASRAGAASPNDPEPSRLLFVAQCAAGNWPAARSAADRLRQMVGSNTLPVDLEIAQTYLRQPTPDPNAAMKQLDPYVADTASDAIKQAATATYCRALILAGRSDEAAARLKPMLDKSPQWPIVWMELAADQKSADAATAWLKDVIPSLSADSIQQQIALAAAWEQIGERYEVSPAHEAARHTLQPIIARPPVPALAWRLWGEVNHSLGNLQEAEHGRQELLKLDPKNPNSQNDLAYTLLLEGGADRLTKAESLATAAIAARPDVSTFYDTLARILLQTGRTDEAIKNFRIAVEKDSNDVDAMIGLAEVLQSRPANRDEAKELLSRINTLVDRGASLTPDVRKQLDHLRSGLSLSI
jgi:tetratricopeptide (TPR) repeat protein